MSPVRLPGLLKSMGRPKGWTLLIAMERCWPRIFRCRPLYADARLIWNPTETAEKLASVFPDVDAEKLATRLSKGSAYVPLKRNVTPEIQRQIYQFGLPGIKFEETVSRIYPHGNLAAHVVGYVSRPDNVGIAGIERSMEDVIDSRGPNRLPVKLSIDTRVQHAVADELRASIEEFDALGGAGVVMNVNTGEIIALVSLPDFDPNSVMDFPEDAHRNRATLSVYEMGSTFKPSPPQWFWTKGLQTCRQNLTRVSQSRSVASRFLIITLSVAG